jgi:hypothetical protein
MQIYFVVTGSKEQTYSQKVAGFVFYRVPEHCSFIAQKARIRRDIP